MRNINKKLLLGGGIIGLAVFAFLAIGVFGVHTFFIDEKVDEANPFAVASETASETTPAPDAESDDEPDGPSDGDTQPLDDSATEPSEAESETAEPTVLTITSGAFVNGEHPTSGDALVITAEGSDQRFLRFENFQGDNGPDLNVYLRSSANPDDYIDLGDLKGNIGDQNYELPIDIDPSVYDLVDIWCVRFGVSFGTATLSA